MSDFVKNGCFLLQDMLLDEKTGCLLKFSGELEDVSREDFHELFSGHGKIKWVDFTRGAKEVNKHFHSRTASLRVGTWLSMEYVCLPQGCFAI